MTRREPRVHTKNSLKKYLTSQDFIFGLRPNRKRERERERKKEREREREREREEKRQSSLFDSRVFVGRISLGQEVKLLYAKRATRGYRNYKISSKFKVRVFTKTKKMWYPRKPHYLR